MCSGIWGCAVGALGEFGIAGDIGIIAFGFDLAGRGEWMFVCIVGGFLCGRKGPPSGKHVFCKL